MQTRWELEGECAVVLAWIDCILGPMLLGTCLAAGNLVIGEDGAGHYGVHGGEATSHIVEQAVEVLHLQHSLICNTNLSYTQVSVLAVRTSSPATAVFPPP